MYKQSNIEIVSFINFIKQYKLHAFRAPRPTVISHIIMNVPLLPLYLEQTGVTDNYRTNRPLVIVVFINNM